ncbi:MAG TPA: hypothetical protein VGK00_03045 [Anaerolineales bacterium]|jgi:dihydroorotate dehydrogenase electron transfer subunit
MHSAKGCIEEVYLDERRAARLSCPAALLPAPGQYLLAAALGDQETALAQPVFSAGVCLGGFHAAPPLPAHWQPGTQLDLRGPLGKGFSLPAGARAVVLAAFGSCARLLALLEPALAQKASVVLLADRPPAGLPAALEILPLAALPETAPWADYLALDLPRANLPELIDLLNLYPREKYAQAKAFQPGGLTQALLETPMPCGGLADCGACAVTLRPGSGYKLACQDGPVFDL